MPVLVMGLLTCVLVERFRWFGYGFGLPPAVRDILLRFDQESSRKMDHRIKARLIVQGLAMILVYCCAGLSFSGSRHHWVIGQSGSYSLEWYY